MPHLISHIDILPTLCDLLGVDIPSGVQGCSLKNAIQTGKPLDREDIFIQFDGSGARGNFQRCLIRGPHKLIVDLFKDEIYFELHHVDEDPQEKYNRAFDQPDIVRPMFDTLTNMMQDMNDLITIPSDAYDVFLSDYTRYRTPEPYYIHA